MSQFIYLTGERRQRRRRTTKKSYYVTIKLAGAADEKRINGCFGLTAREARDAEATVTRLKRQGVLDEWSWVEPDADEGGWRSGHGYPGYDDLMRHLGAE